MGSITGIGVGMAAAMKQANARANVGIFQDKLENELKNGLFDEAVGAIKQAMSATRNVRVRTPEGIAYEHVPDFAVRLAAAVVVTQYALGKPVNRTEMIVKNEGASPQQRAEDAARTLLEDPDTLIHVLDDWREAAVSSKGARKVAVPITIDD